MSDVTNDERIALIDLGVASCDNCRNRRRLHLCEAIDVVSIRFVDKYKGSTGVKIVEDNIVCNNWNPK